MRKGCWHAADDIACRGRGGVNARGGKVRPLLATRYAGRSLRKWQAAMYEAARCCCRCCIGNSLVCSGRLKGGRAGCVCAAAPHR